MTVKKDKITPSLEEIEKGLLAIPKKAHKFFKKTTPIDTGYARKHTKLIGSKGRHKIKGGYKYASYLNVGWSKQAPDGMTNPTTDYINSLIKKIMRK